MNKERSYLKPRDDVGGKMHEYVRSKCVDGEIISPHPDAEVFNDYLSRYQEDINRIVGKFRYPSHLLSHDELVSEANLSLIKKRDEILSNFEGPFDFTAFKKLAYAFTKNIIGWTYYRLANHSYHARRVNLEHTTEEGVKTTFEWAVETLGEEEPFYEEFDRASKCEYLCKMLKEYAGIFTDGEVKIFALLEKGLSRKVIAEELGITHQAVSLRCINLFEKISHHFNVGVLEDNSYAEVGEGHQAIKDFFSSESGYVPLTGLDGKMVREFLLENINVYTPAAIAKKLFKGRYSSRQIAAFAVSNGLHLCLKQASRPYRFSKGEEKKILSLYQEGRSSAEIASETQIPLASVAGKRGHFVKLGLLERTSRER